MMTILVGCAESNQPKCTDENVITTLQSIIYNASYEQVSISEIRTLDKDEEFKKCTCAATMQVRSLNLPIEYSAQLTDDEKNVQVEIIKKR